MNWQICTNCCCHWLFNYINLTSTCGITGIFYRTLFHASNSRWHTNHNSWLGKIATLVNFLNKVFEHSLSGIEICDNSIFKWSNRHNISRSSTNHSFCLKSNRQNGASVLIDRHYRWFIKNNSAAANIDQCVGCS